jgi:L-lactate dehydrogenase (cytochrome)/(S)-mandelate dehydrogenase
MDRAAALGYAAMMVTVDVQALGNREHERRRGMGNPPVLTPRRIVNAARHPRWSVNLLRHQRISARNLVAERGTQAAMSSITRHARMISPELSWADLAWMREHWTGQLYVKGILDAADAQRAADVGANGVVVSNHGGRQLDGAVASLDALPAVAAQVGADLEVLLDGGVRRGADVVKALALGARAVCIGRPFLYGLAVDGPAGARRVVEILRDEIARTLTLMGVGSLDELGPEWLLPAGTTLT